MRKKKAIEPAANSYGPYLKKVVAAHSAAVYNRPKKSAPEGGGKNRKVLACAAPFAIAVPQAL